MGGRVKVRFVGGEGYRALDSSSMMDEVMGGATGGLGMSAGGWEQKESADGC